jgi:hypothetical protein
MTEEKQKVTHRQHFASQFRLPPLPSIFLQRHNSVRSCLDYFVAGFEGIFVDFKYIFFGFIGVVYLA